MLRAFKLSVVIAAVLFAAPAAQATGKIVVAHDEWALSDVGFQYAPSTQQFALNIANFFTGGEQGRFLVYSPNAGLTGDRLASTMRNAGHEWTIVDPASDVAVDLNGFTAIFVGGFPVDNVALSAFVANGGNVYVMAGTGLGVSDSVHWNGFLNVFGLHLDTDYNGISGLYSVSATHALFTNVSSLVHVVGNNIRTTGLVPGARIVQTIGSAGVFAVYHDDSVLLPMALKTSVCGDAVYVRRGSKGHLSVHFIGSALPGDAIDPQSVRILGLSPLKAYVEDRLSLAPRNSSAPCSEHRDGVPDLHLKFDLQKVSQKLWSILGNTITDGDVVTVTATGRLKPAFGGALIRGEAVLTLRTR